MTGTHPQKVSISPYLAGYGPYGWPYPGYPCVLVRTPYGVPPSMGTIGDIVKLPIHSSLSGKPTAFKEGGSLVKFEPFDGTSKRLKALTFIQQFDIVYHIGNFIEESKIRKATTMLKDNALQ